MGVTNGAPEPELLMNVPPVATTMALPEALLAMVPPLPRIRLAETVSARKLLLPIACAPPMVMPPLPS